MSETDKPKAEPKAETKVGDLLFTPVAFVFEGDSDRNLRTLWPGNLPRIGEHLKLKGRDIAWQVADVEWMIDVMVKEQRLERMVIIKLEKVG